MEPNRAIAILERQRDSAAGLVRRSSEFTKWQRDTEVAVGRIFGDESRHLSDFKAVRYSLQAYTNHTPESAFEQAFQRGIANAQAVLQSLIDEIREYELDEDVPVGAPDQLNLIERLCLRFHGVARQLQARHADRETLAIDDEYDVQDLLHAILRIHFDDIREEEWTPSYAGGSSRVDFLLKQEQIIIEVKKTRPSLRVADLGAELLVDIARYSRHPDCMTLVCFIYDPEGRIGNPVGLERDLESHEGTLKVRVIVAPKS
jgi:hypothetical protein